MQTDPSVSHAANPTFARPGATGYDRTPVGVPAQGQASLTVDPVQQARPTSGTSFLTGAYQPSGDPMIDRMISLERALKQFGNVI